MAQKVNNILWTSYVVGAKELLAEIVCVIIAVFGLSVDAINSEQKFAPDL